MDGMGAAYNAGRWNPVGVKMVYCADSLALAILELRVHLAGVKPKRRFVGLEIEISESALERPELSDLPPSWQRRRQQVPQIRPLDVLELGGLVKCVL